MNQNQLYVEGKLKPLESAIYDPECEESKEYETLCYPLTRVVLLQRIKDWATGAGEECIFWLQGKAGTGKSTISRTIIRNLIEEKHLVASFFFKRNTEEPDRINPVRLFPTIAAQLVRCLPSIAGHAKSEIDDATVRSPVAELSRENQFKKLILGPLQKIDNDSKTPRTIVVVIDALDECNQDESVKHILQVLPGVKQLRSIKVKFLMTSRPEGYICNVIEKTPLKHHCEERILHEERATEDDISIFVRSRLKKFRDKCNQETTREDRKPLVSWPGEDKTTRLVKMAVPLFIFAVTACRFIQDEHCAGMPDDRLEGMLNQEITDHESKIAATYLPVLEQMVHKLEGVVREESIEEFKAVVGPIVLLARPLSAKSLAALLGKRIEIVNKRLKGLHSVLNVPSDPETPVTLFHQSFRDFLLSSEYAKGFSIDETEVHKELQSRCFTVMKNLKKNMCQKKPGTLRKNIDKQVVDEYLKPEIQYSCLYWVEHLQKSGYKLDDGHEVHIFLKKHLLHWLEVLGWMENVSDGVYAISLLHSILAVSKLLYQYQN